MFSPVADQKSLMCAHCLCSGHSDSCNDRWEQMVLVYHCTSTIGFPCTM